MKIVHICLSGQYLDGWGYQENLLPEYMALAGHNVTVVSSTSFFPKYVKKEDVKNILAKGKKYILGHVKVRRISVHVTTSQYPFIVCGLYSLLKEENPDVIFHHDINSSSMMTCWRYCLCHKNVKFFIDNHADEINQSKHKLWNAVIPKGLMRLCVKIIQPKVNKFYGVTPGRCDYLEKVYGASYSKVSLFPIGGDTNAIDNITASKNELRKKYGIPSDSHVIVSGGKMGVDKGTVSLIKAVNKLQKKGKNISLVLFGRFTDDETRQIAENTDGVYVHGWSDRRKTLELLKMSSIACWPIHHTTLIEDAIAASVPLVVRETSNTSHSVSANGVFVQNGTEEELMNAFEKIISDYQSYVDGAEKMHDKYSYVSLVKRFEEDCK